MIDIRPSILAADLLDMGRDIERIVGCGITHLHFDVMDAHFVPNLSFGPALCAAIHQRFPSLYLDVHLMLSEPEKYFEVFRNAGANAITFHAEAVENIHRAIDTIHEMGMEAGISVKPATSVETLYPYLDKLDLILVMTVEPGFGGQKFKPEMLEKLKQLREKGYMKALSVDGGVGASNIGTIYRAGADTFVMGTAVFKSDDPGALISKCKEDCVNE